MNIINEHVMSDAEAREIMAQHSDDFITILAGRVVPELLKLLEALNPCRQVQMMIIDAQSIQDHLENFMTEGPDHNLLREISLEKSEVSLVDKVNLAPGEELVEGYDPMNAGGGTINLVRGPAVKFREDIPMSPDVYPDELVQIHHALSDQDDCAAGPG